MRRRDLIAVAIGALLATALAGGVAWATIPAGDGTISGCYQKNNGQLRVVDLATDPCRASELAISWNQKGPKGDPGANGTNGVDGVSPTVAALQPGDATCPAGGAAITDAAGSTAYVCSGANGHDGQPFSGTFTSPNGEYSISVTNTGITLAHGTHVRVTLTGDTLETRAGLSTTIESGTTLTLKSGTDATLEGGSTTTVKGGANLSLTSGGAASLDSQAGFVGINAPGGLVSLNSGGSCFPVARVTDTVSGGAISSGSSSVCAG